MVEINPVAKTEMAELTAIAGGEKVKKVPAVVLTKDDGTQVRRTPCRPRSWANLSRSELYSHRNARADLHLLGQPLSIAPQELLRESSDIIDHLVAASGTPAVGAPEEQARWREWVDEHWVRAGQYPIAAPVRGAPKKRTQRLITYQLCFSEAPLTGATLGYHPRCAW